MSFQHVARRHMSFLGCCICLIGKVFGTDYGPQDHQLQDFVLQDGDRIWGAHLAVGRFVIPAGAVVQVLPYDGADPEKGSLHVKALHIEVAGTLKGDGSGYTGGGGGGGGGQFTYGGYRPAARERDYDYLFPGGVAPYGNGAYSGQSAHHGTYYFDGYRRYAGYGGRADGPFGGDPGSDTDSTPILDGGYAGAGTNGDSTTDAAVHKGSGGAGGKGGDGIDNAGYSDPSADGGGGGAGGMGGGSIALTARESFTLSDGAVISASGFLGGNAVGSIGGNVLPPQEGHGGLAGPADAIYHGYVGASGGSGAGGGILLMLPGSSSVDFGTSATITSLGGGEKAANGGTVKIFFADELPTTAALHVAAGRVYLSQGLSAGKPRFSPQQAYDVMTGGHLTAALLIADLTSPTVSVAGVSITDFSTTCPLPAAGGFSALLLYDYESAALSDGQFQTWFSLNQPAGTGAGSAAKSAPSSPALLSSTDAHFAPSQHVRIETGNHYTAAVLLKDLTSPTASIAASGAFDFSASYESSPPGSLDAMFLYDAELGMVTQLLITGKI